MNSPVPEQPNLQQFMESLFTQMNNNIQTQLTNQNQVLMEEIQTLKSQLKAKELETVEDVLTSAASLMNHSYESNTPIPSAVASTWKNAARSYPLCRSIKKAFAAEEISSDDERLIKLSKLMLDPKQVKEKPKPAKSLCSRCDRAGHTKASCFAKTNANGIKLE
jgi:mannosyltransferase OCH1-like enzyme